MIAFLKTFEAWTVPAIHRIGPDQGLAVSKMIPAVLLAHFINATIVLMSFPQRTSGLIIWYGLMLLVMGFSALKWIQHRHRVLKRVSKRYIRRSTTISAAYGGLWGYLGAAYMGSLPHDTELILMTLCAGTAGAGSINLAPVLPAALAFMLAILLPLAAKFLIFGTFNEVVVGLSIVSYAIFLWALCCTIARLAISKSEAHADIQQNNEILQAIIENFPGGICYLDKDHRLALMNEQARSLFDLPENCSVNGPPHLSEVPAGISVSGKSVSCREEEPLLSEELVHDRAPYQFERIRANGTVLDVRGAPAGDGGFITTYLDITERHQSQAQIMYLAQHDALTELANRSHFHAHLEQTISHGRESFALLVFDLDRFKEVNDTFGHPVGDELLKHVAQRTRACLRRGDMLARLGGDEFAILAKTLGGPKDAEALAARISSEVLKPFSLDGLTIMVGISIGIAMWPANAETGEKLFARADLALYRAKSLRNGGYCFFADDMEAELSARRALEADLGQALSNNEFELHYQPLLNLETSAVCGFEALLRWRRPGHGLASPATFIPLAEETGLIIPLGEWVLRRACAEAVKWPENVKIAVNLSPEQLKHEKFMQSLAEALQLSGLAPHRLELEITESVMLSDSTETVAILEAVRALGVKIAIDDFGTGYSSLNTLRKFSFDKIKIDKSFVQEAGTPKANAILKSIAELGLSLGLMITAEGVETAEQLSAVRKHGCTEAQGYHIARPLEASDIDMVIGLNAEGPSSENAAPWRSIA